MSRAAALQSSRIQARAIRVEDAIYRRWLAKQEAYRAAPHGMKRQRLRELQQVTAEYLSETECAP